MANQNRPSVAPPAQAAALSDVEQAEAIATAKREATATVQSSSPVETVAPVQPVTGLRVRFSPKDPSKAKTDSGMTVCTASLLGCFGSLPVMIHGLALSLRDRDRTIAVYMPGPMYQRSIGPAQIALTQPIMVNGKHVTHADDPAGVKALADLEQAIRNAWATANASGKPFGVEYALSL